MRQHREHLRKQGRTVDGTKRKQKREHYRMGYQAYLNRVGQHDFPDELSYYQLVDWQDGWHDAAHGIELVA